MSTLIDMVNEGMTVTFVRYCNEEFWYQTECGFEFPVPLTETYRATLLAEDRAALFLRHIRRHIEYLDTARRAQAAGLVA